MPSIEQIKKVLLSQSINITGVFHVGAHECEELNVYTELGLSKEDIIWIDAINSKVIEAKNKGIKNIYNAVITDKDDEDIIFNVANNVQSSSILEFGTHLNEHPGVFYIDHIKLKSITIDSFFERNNIDVSKYNYWHFDIQGAELHALKGAIKNIKYVKVIYLEVNEKELYKGCGLIDEVDLFLAEYGFKRVITNITKFGWGDALYVLINNPLSDEYPIYTKENKPEININFSHTLRLAREGKISRR
jgi:FkbM family methyltransferase